ncbi:MAG: hypothetical protein V4529_16945 [Gemmatimonadota bacterium]
MAKELSTRDELIAALVTDKYSGFKDGDESILTGASDARLEEFRVASEANRTTHGTIARMEADGRQTAARLKVAEARIVTLEQPMTDDDFVARLAPTSPIKTLLESRAAEEKTLHASLVSSLKDLGGETEEQLKKRTIPELQTLARYAHVKVLDFSGKGVPVERNASQHVSYAPPDPYKAGLEAHRAAESKH